VESGHSTGNPERAMDCKSRLEDVVFLTAWGTPAARDWKSGDASQDTLDRNARPLNELAMLAGWTSPQARDHFPAHTQEYLERKRKQHNNAGGMGGDLPDQAKLGAWPTPMAGTPAQKGYNEAGNSDPSTDFGSGPIGYLLGRNGWEIVPASGQLNAAHSRWLMGLPPAWDDCGVTAMESLRKRRKRS
jgi:hypothetical protein